MDKNLLKGMDLIPIEKQNQFLKEVITLDDIKDTYSQLSELNRFIRGTDIIDALLIKNKDNSSFNRLSFETIIVIYNNIIQEFKIINNLTPIPPKYTDPFYYHILHYALSNCSQIIEHSLTKNFMDLKFIDVYEFFNDMFQFLENPFWNLNVLNSRDSGFITFYQELELLNTNLNDNSNYNELEKKELMDMFAGMNRLKSKIVPLEFDFHLRNYLSHHSIDDIENNTISNIDKLIYFSKIFFIPKVLTFLYEDIEKFINQLTPQQPSYYLSLSKISENNVFINITFYSKNLDSPLFFHSLSKFSQNNQIMVNNVVINQDYEKVQFSLVFSSPQNKEMESRIFKEFVQTLSEYLLSNCQMYPTQIHVSDLMLNLGSSLREVSILSQMDKNKTTSGNKKSKI